MMSEERVELTKQEKHASILKDKIAISVSIANREEVLAQIAELKEAMETAKAAVHDLAVAIDSLELKFDLRSV